MPRQEHVLTVFLASPGDLQPEREKVEEVIRDFNDLWSRPFRLRIELMRWETHAYPDAGADAQDVINNQIPDDYDIFLGIMWCRFGTPTGRAESGTVEEFSRARARHLIDQNAVHLMFYFKSREPLPDAADLEQVAYVEAFQRMLQTQGILHWGFTDINDFGRLVGIHLTRQVQASRAFKSLFTQLATKPEKTASPQDETLTLKFSRTEALDPFGVMLVAHSAFMSKTSAAMQHHARINDALADFKTRSDTVVAKIHSLTALVKANPSATDTADALLICVLRDWEIAMLALSDSLDHEFSDYVTSANASIDSFIHATAARIGLPRTVRLEQMNETCLQMIVQWRDVTGRLQDASRTVVGTLATLPEYTPGIAVAKMKAELALTRHADFRTRQLVILTEGELMLRELLAG
jgi:hypothetical protein